MLLLLVRKGFRLSFWLNQLLPGKRGSNELDQGQGIGRGSQEKPGDHDGGAALGHGIRTVTGRAVTPGSAAGSLFWSDQPLSFWGGYDPATGEIIDRRHPLSGTLAAGSLLAIPSTRGSSTTTAVLLEALRLGTAPAALITAGIDLYLALPAITAAEMYGRPMPVLALSPEAFAGLSVYKHAVLAESELRLSRPS